jgi:hypothetical protein
MTFYEALKRLNIEDYRDRIWNSNSHGELMHIYDYIAMAQRVTDEDVVVFRPFFELCVKWAEANWSRPESCFQHMPRLMDEMAQALAGKKPNEKEKEKTG